MWGVLAQDLESYDVSVCDVLDVHALLTGVVLLQVCEAWKLGCMLMAFCCWVAIRIWQP